MLPRESEATVSEAEELLLLVVDQSGISPSYVAGFHLQVVAQRGVAFFLCSERRFAQGAFSSTNAFVRAGALADNGGNGSSTHSGE